jgi:Winged helix-turn helix
VQATTGCGNRGVAQRSLHEMNRCAAFQTMGRVSVSQPVRANRSVKLPLSITLRKTKSGGSGFFYIPTKTAQALALRAKIILACAEGKPNGVVARQTRVRQQTVGKWRSRFLSNGLEGLLDEPRPGTPRTVSDSDVEKVLTTTLESVPRHATHWEHAVTGAAVWFKPEHDQSHLAGLRLAAAAKRSSFRRTHCSSTRYAISSACI